MKSQSQNAEELKPCPEQRLLSVDGSPLHVHGKAEVELCLAGECFKVETMVVSPLTSEAILGLDFLRKYKATISLGDEELFLAKGKLRVPLRSSTRKEKSTHPIRAVEEFHIPPRSEMIIMAQMSEPVNEGSWMVVSEWSDRPPAAVARALVTPKWGKVPVRLLNPREESVTVGAGAAIATLELIEQPSDSVVANIDVEQSDVIENESLIQKLVDERANDLGDKQREAFLHLLLKYSDVFATSESDLGRTGELKHKIQTGDSSPIRQAVRRLPPPRRQEVQKLLCGMLKNKIIQPSSSPWAAPIVLAKKKNGDWRFCVDYRKLNEVTRKDAYPLPRIDDTLGTLAGSKLFTTLDLRSGYWQVEMDNEDRAKTAFCTSEGLYEFNVMPFGVTVAEGEVDRTSSNGVPTPVGGKSGRLRERHRSAEGAV